MTDQEPRLLPATDEELAFTLAHALRFDGRKQFTTSGEMMAKITAAHLIEQLRRLGYVVMKRPPAPVPSSSYKDDPHLTD